MCPVMVAPQAIRSTSTGPLVSVTWVTWGKTGQEILQELKKDYLFPIRSCSKRRSFQCCHLSVKLSEKDYKYDVCSQGSLAWVQPVTRHGQKLVDNINAEKSCLGTYMCTVLVLTTKSWQKFKITNNDWSFLYCVFLTSNCIILNVKTLVAFKQFISYDLFTNFINNYPCEYSTGVRYISSVVRVV